MVNNNESQFVGVAIAVHNRKERTRECLIALYENLYEHLHICVVDDGSSDGTYDMLNAEFPDIQIVCGDGNLWWGGGTNLAIKKCLNAGCDSVLLLNPDCIVQADTISKLVKLSDKENDTIIASVVVDINKPEKIWWAGTKWGPLKNIPFIWILRRIYKDKVDVKSLPSAPYVTSETTGRAVLVPESVFSRFGYIDQDTFPMYAGDNDFGLKVTTKGGRALVHTGAIVRLYSDETGQNIHVGLGGLVIALVKKMFYKKHGELARCWWVLLCRYAPFYAIVPSYILVWLLAVKSIILSPYKHTK